MRIYTTFSQLITGLKYLSVKYLNSGTVRNKVCLCLAGFGIVNNNFALLLGILNGNGTSELCDNCKSLRLSCLEQFLDTRKTLGNIVTCYTTGVEGSHGKLGTRLTDRLSCDNTDCS